MFIPASNEWHTITEWDIHVYAYVKEHTEPVSMMYCIEIGWGYFSIPLEVQTSEHVVQTQAGSFNLPILEMHKLSGTGQD